jgi:hypothetical protein
MTTCEPLPPGGEDDEPLTLFAADSLASPQAKRALSSPRPTRGGSGPPSRTSFAVYDPATSCWKTSRVSLAGEWETYSETWPPAGMTRNGAAFQLPTLAPRICENESGSWPTPCARDWRGSSPGVVARKPEGDDTLPDRVLRRGDSGPLNPPWTEWLMGYPAGWTDCGD